LDLAVGQQVVEDVLRAAQSLLGQAKKAKGKLAGLLSYCSLRCFGLGISGLSAKIDMLSNNISAKYAPNVHFYSFSLPIS
jgi:hypothetical protein